MNMPADMPAFPVTGQPCAAQTLAGPVPLLGFTKREALTAAALPGVITAAASDIDESPVAIAMRAVAIADAVLARLNSPKQNRQ